MAYAGHLVTISLGGTPTSFTGAATTDLGSNRFQVSDPVKRVLSPGHTVTVLDNGTPVDSSLYRVDYLFGIVRMISGYDGPLTVTATYVPVLVVAEATSASVTTSRDEIETLFFGTAEKATIAGQRGCTISHSGMRLITETLDAGEVGETWEALTADDTPKFVQVALPGGKALRAWGWYPSLAANASPGEAITHDLEFRSSSRRAAGRTEDVNYAVGDAE